MRITDNMVTNNLLAQIQQLTSQQSQLQSEVGSGLAVAGLGGFEESGDVGHVADCNRNTPARLI